MRWPKRQRWQFTCLVCGWEAKGVNAERLNTIADDHACLCSGYTLDDQTASPPKPGTRP